MKNKINNINWLIDGETEIKKLEKIRYRTFSWFNFLLEISGQVNSVTDWLKFNTCIKVKFLVKIELNFLEVLYYSACKGEHLANTQSY